MTLQKSQEFGFEKLQKIPNMALKIFKISEIGIFTESL
jgi:hypothetical protein